VRFVLVSVRLRVAIGLSASRTFRRFQVDIFVDVFFGDPVRVAGRTRVLGLRRALARHDHRLKHTRQLQIDTQDVTDRFDRPEFRISGLVGRGVLLLVARLG
jgi:hypothetical protein